MASVESGVHALLSRIAKAEHTSGGKALVAEDKPEEKEEEKVVIEVEPKTVYESMMENDDECYLLH